MSQIVFGIILTLAGLTIYALADKITLPKKRS
ncbi:MAG: hypothetical protein Ta2B_05430 [Termitinemataceae bacterium]|nr:MAG: hypothetical protein Ta2B_05430 [Termitinemataceae bacterium]